MKIKTYLKDIEIELEVYKVQVALFGGPSVLIYNEDRTQIYETQKPEEVKTICNFIGKNKIKAYVCGSQNKKGQIVMQKVIPESISNKYNW